MQLDRKVLAFGQLPSSKGDLYVPASGRKGYAHNLTLHNTNTTSEDVVLNYHDGASEHEILSETIPAGDSLYLEFPGEGEVVGIGGKFTGNTTTASKVTFKFSGTEEIPDTVQDDIIWEWNGLDITQFGDGVGNGDSSYGSPDGTLSVGAIPGSGIDVPSGNALIYTVGSATSAVEYYKINDLPPLPERFIFRARLGPETTNCKAVMCFGQDATHYAGFCWAVGQSTYQIGNNNSGVWEAGLYLRTGGLGTVQSGAVFEIDAMLRHPDTGVDPQICLDVRGPGVSAIGYGKGGESWTLWGGSGALYDSSWQSGGNLTPAISFTLGAAATAAWISELQILRHPWQKVA